MSGLAELYYECLVSDVMIADNARVCVCVNEEMCQRFLSLYSKENLNY